MKLHLLVATALLATTTTMTAAARADTTGSTGGGASFSTYQPSLVLTENLTYNGVYPSDSSGGLTDSAQRYEIGMIRNFGGNFNPGGWNADGGTHSSIVYSGLSAVLGTNYGSTGGSTFYVPDLRGATIVGAKSIGGQGAVSNYAVGQATGSAAATLTEAQLPAHTHALAHGTTGSAGSGAPVDLTQPSLSMTYLIAADGFYPNGGTPQMIGQVTAFAGSYIPSGWRPADGSLLDTTTYASLFSVIGNTYGGDGINTFALPDLRGRTITGTGTGNGLTPVTLGETYGNASTVVTLGEMPAHDHTLPGGGTTASTGGNSAIGNIQPSLGLNYLVVTSGGFPSRDQGLDGDLPYLGEIVAFAGDFVPTGFAAADGSLMSIARNTALFSLFGTTYGGNGISTFGLPDLRGRTIIGSGGGFVTGQALGSETTMLSLANLPAHTHSIESAGTVPEPAAWALMIGGFGLTGVRMRRRRMDTVSC